MHDESAPYGDRRLAPADPPPRWTRRAVLLAVAAAVAFVGALTAVATCVAKVVRAPDGGGVDFSVLPLGAVVAVLVVAGCLLTVAGQRARRNGGTGPGAQPRP